MDAVRDPQTQVWPRAQAQGADRPDPLPHPPSQPSWTLCPQCLARLGAAIVGTEFPVGRPACENVDVLAKRRSEQWPTLPKTSSASIGQRQDHRHSIFMHRAHIDGPGAIFTLVVHRPCRSRAPEVRTPAHSQHLIWRSELRSTSPSPCSEYLCRWL